MDQTSWRTPSSVLGPVNSGSFVLLVMSCHRMSWHVVSSGGAAPHQLITLLGIFLCGVMVTLLFMPLLPSTP